MRCGRHVPFSKDSIMPHSLEDDPGSCLPSLASIDKLVVRTGIKEVEGQAKTINSAGGSM